MNRGGRPRVVLGSAATVAFVVSQAALALALGGRVADIRAAGPAIRANLELTDAFAPRFVRLLERGGPIYLRVDAELWEDRRSWDRLVGPPAIDLFRLALDLTTGELMVEDRFGVEARYPAYPAPLAVSLEIGRLERVADDRRYFAIVVATIGTVAERDIEEFEGAVFGSEGRGRFGEIGRLLFRTVLQITDYMQATTARLRSRTVTGQQIRAG